MARPMKQGLDYFPLDVGFLQDIKIRRIMKACGTQSISVLICLLVYIYRDDGYFLRWDKDMPFLVAEELGIREGAVTDIVAKAVQVDFFDSVMYEKYSILTSRGIQRRYFKAVADAKRIGVQCNGDFLLISVSSGRNRVSSGINSINSGINPQRKEKERKEKERKEDQSMTGSVSPSSFGEGDREEPFSRAHENGRIPILCPRCGKEMIRKMNRDTEETFWGHKEYCPEECRASYRSLEELERDRNRRQRERDAGQKEREKESDAWRSVLDEQQRLFAKEKKGESGTNE